jgi:hypothetical protein
MGRWCRSTAAHSAPSRLYPPVRPLRLISPTIPCSTADRLALSTFPLTVPPRSPRLQLLGPVPPSMPSAPIPLLLVMSGLLPIRDSGTPQTTVRPLPRSAVDARQVGASASVRPRRLALTPSSTASLPLTVQRHSSKPRTRAQTGR